MSTLKERMHSRLAEMGLEPKRALGQNFLISESVVERILAAVKRENAKSLIEVGPGLGSLTDSLLDFGVPIKLIELDRNFAQYWREVANKINQVKNQNACPIEVIEADALKLDWLKLQLGEASVLVSNLPYQISSSLVIERSIEESGVQSMILMFQKEVAQRLVAKCKSEEYGLLTVIAQSFWRVDFLLEAGPRDFFPPPNVASRVVVFRRRIENTGAQRSFSATKYLSFVKAGFAQRRKFLIKNLGALSELKRELLEKAFQDVGLDGKVRAEELDPDLFLRLYRACYGN